MYVAYVQGKVEQSWESYKKHQAMTSRIFFQVAPTGDIAKLRVLEWTGDKQTLINAIAAVKSSAPFNPPPFSKPVDFIFGFRHDPSMAKFPVLHHPSPPPSIGSSPSSQPIPLSPQSQQPYTQPPSSPPPYSQPPYAQPPYTPPVPVSRYRSSRQQVYLGVDDEHWINNNNEGIITLEDDSVWLVNPVDRVECAIWLSTETVLVKDSDDTSYPYLLINTDSNEKVTAKCLKN